MIKSDQRLRNISILLILAAIAFAVTFLCSYLIMPGQRALAGDQDIFYVIGRNWANGELPYVTAWDSKGPIIFLANALGYLITKSALGVVVLDAFNFTLVLWCSFYFLKKYCNTRYAMVCLFPFIANFAAISSGGNMVGNYTLLLSVICTFLTYKWSRGFQEGKTEHPYRYSFVYGLFFAACLLSRLTNAMMLCASMAGILCVLVYQRQWRNIGANVIAFSAGFLLMLAPFALYFAHHNAFQDMWYATFSYNLEYTANSHPVEYAHGQHPTIYYMLYNMCLATTVGIAIIALMHRTRRKIALFWGSICIVCMIWLLKSQAYANYTISYLPIIFIGFIELSVLYKETGKKVYKWYYLCVLLFAIISIANRARVSTLETTLTASNLLKSYQQQIALIRTIPPQDSFILYNGDSYVYATLDIHPHYPYWVVQDWAIGMGKSLRDKVRLCYKNGDAKWILVENYERCHIKDILLSRYEICKENKEGNLTLWRLK